MYRRSEDGSYTLFFGCGVLPLLVFLFVLSVDYSSYLRSRQIAQRAADDAALLAWKYLPYEERAARAVRELLPTRNIAVDDNTLSAGYTDPELNDEFEVALQIEVPLRFASFFATDATLPVRVVSRTRATPQDVMIALDRSIYMAPSRIGDAWGPAPTTSYFSTLPVIGFSAANSATVPAEVPEFMAQLCFNGFFRMAKQVALALYEYFAAAGRNGVGIGVYPGSGGAFSLLRPMLQPVKTLPSGGEAYPLYKDYYVYDGSQSLGASAWCAGAALQAAPDNALAFPSSTSIPKLFEVSDMSGVPLLTQAGIATDFNKEYEPAFSVREAIWSAVAKSYSVDTNTLLESVLAQAVAGPDSTFTAPGSLAIRGGLSGTSTRTAILIAGDVPQIAGNRFPSADNSVENALTESFGKFRTLLTEQKSMRLKVVYVLLDDPQRQDGPELSQGRVDALASFLSEQQDEKNLGGRLEIQLIHGTSFERVIEETLSVAVLDNKRVMLSN